MANPFIGKVSTGKIVGNHDTTVSPSKHKPSKFDNVRSDLEAKNAARESQVPPEVTRVSADQKQTTESDLRRRLQNSGNPSPESLNPAIQKAQEDIQKVRKKVEALPKSSAFDPLRLRLDSVEAMFKRTDSLVRGLNSTYTPAEMMQVQIQMYQFTENLELLVKAVEQTNSGVKTILQTQV